MEPNPNHPFSWLSSSTSNLSFSLSPIEDTDMLDHHRQDSNFVEEEEPRPDPVREQDREPMFEKPLTPSDVGKLNRLVIPKQHAEKHFPLGGGGGDSVPDKGFLLSFEDESGKSWRFRYSYWNSSQSYVLTKGWSRFVKEKRLDAGDVVLFGKHRRDGSRMFIGWRRRANQAHNSGRQQQQQTHGAGGSGPSSSAGGWTTAGAAALYNAHPYLSHPLPYHHQPDHCHHHAGGPPPAAQIQTTTTVGSPKRLRLFGVNLECHQPDEAEPSAPEGSIPPTHQGFEQDHQQQLYGQIYYSPNHLYHYMDMNYSKDVNNMRNHRGG